MSVTLTLLDQSNLLVVSKKQSRMSSFDSHQDDQTLERIECKRQDMQLKSIRVECNLGNNHI